MILDERKRKILQAIIDDYIGTAEPIGSRTVARKHEMGLSSATIRNEMADLEEMGYLEQPHTSSGRIPSDKGYRFYVDQLMKVNELNIDEIESIRSAMEMRINELSQIIRQASAVLSRFTKYTSMAVTPKMKASIIKSIQAIFMEKGKAMVIVITNAGVVRNSLVDISDTFQQYELGIISNAINSKIAGLTLEQVNLNAIKELEIELEMPSGSLMPIMNAVAECINQIDNPEVYVEGTTNIFNFPEFRDVSKAKEFISLLDEKTNIRKLLFDTVDRGRITVKIGSENDMTSIKDCSVIISDYNIANTLVGSIGIIGPTRMEYPKVISSIKYIRKLMSEEVSKLLGIDHQKCD